ncbi:MAG: thioredoxin domain-containing protein [Deltaproteobacteria bacterium]|nr:thioredoxin domain-containing protein [Deltaproteobacteria bacterium]
MTGMLQEPAAGSAPSHGDLRGTVAMIAILALAVVGAVVNVESTEVYMNLRIAPDDYDSSCNISETVNCEEVEKSPWAVLLGVPTALWAVIGYVAVAGLALVGLAARRRERGILLLVSGFCLGVGLFLVYLMAFVIGSWCTLCLATDAVNLGLVALAILAARLDGLSPWRAVADDVRWLLGSPLALAGHVAFAGLLVAAGFAATAWWVNPPIAEAVIRRQVEETLALSLEGVESATLDREKEGNPGVDPEGTWAGEAIPAAGCEHVKDCACDDGATPPRREKKVTLMGSDEKGHHWIGAPEPVLRIEEFTDYECPHCRSAHMRLRRLLSKYPGQILVVHRHFPLDPGCNPMLEGRSFHERACELSRVAYCAGEQGRFWEMNDLLFQRQREIHEERTRAEELAGLLELDMDRFQCCLTAESTLAHIRADVDEGMRQGIKGTPAFVVDGEVYLGKLPTSVLKVLPDE